VDLEIKGKVAIVTGAANGLGASISRRLCEEGAKVVLADISEHQLAATLKEFNDAGYEAEAVTTDVTSEESVAALVERAIARFGRVDILVNNAGFTRDMRITKMSVADWDAVVDVTLKGAFLCTRAVVPHMVAQEEGRIINISSRAHLGNPGQANYSAAKAGLIGFTRAMALEQGRHRITVNAVAPGIIGTQAVKSLPHFDKIMESATKTTPIPRIGEPEDVSAAVAFLASSLAGYITGEVVHVTGGRY
jgi:3-oxoacyl-[acyl-carrier protein] reductase